MGKKKKKKSRDSKRLVDLADLDGVDTQVEQVPVTGSASDPMDLPKVESVPEGADSRGRHAGLIAATIVVVWALIVLATAAGIIAGVVGWDDMSELIAVINVPIGGIAGYYFRG